MWNENRRRHLLTVTNSIASLGLTTACCAAVILAAALALLPGSAHAATVFIQVTQNDSGHALCNVFCTQIVGGGPATQAPISRSNTAGQFLTGAGEVTATTMKMSSSTNAAGGVSLGLSDTFTVLGEGSGVVSLTAVWHATGSVSSVGLGNGSVQGILGATQIRIGTMGSTNIAAGTLYTVSAFSGPDTTKSTSPFNVFGPSPISFDSDMTATYTFPAAIGSAFDMAFLLSSGFTFGAADFSHTATLSFNTPSGVYLTSGLGGIFGDAPAVVGTPLPAALPLFASGLGVLGLLARRRRKTAVAA